MGFPWRERKRRKNRDANETLKVLNIWNESKVKKKATMQNIG